MGDSSANYGRFDQLADEFIGRFRRNEHPVLQEYIDRFPEMGDEIRELFPALIEVELAEQALDDHPDWSQKALPAASPFPMKDYKILREIGRGGMGVVYEAEQISLNRRVALKVLPRVLKPNSIALIRFRREAQSAARLHHTNIVPVFDVGQENDVVYYAMQLIQGRSLDLVVDELKRLRDESLEAGSPRRKAAIARERGDRNVPRTQGEPDRGWPPGVATMATMRNSPPSSRAMAESLLSGHLRPRRPRTESNGNVADASTTPNPAHGERLDDPSTRPSGFRSSPDDASPQGSIMMPEGAPLSKSDASGRRQPFFRSVAWIGLQVASGLAHAHDRGIIHRDIKPSNLLLDAAGMVWITDFGLAKSSDDDLTKSGDLIGTLRYMPPERFKGEGDVRSDVYALGATLYEILGLRPVFDSPDRLQLIRHVQDLEPPRLRSIDPWIPRDLESIVHKAIEKEPRRRYASADEFRQDLRRFLDGEPIKARQVNELERLWKWSRRHPAISGLVLLVGASLLGGTVVSTGFALRAGDEAESARRANFRSRQSELAAQDAEHRALLERDNSLRLSADLAVDRGIALAEGGQPELGLHWMLQGLRTAPDGRDGFTAMVRQNLSGWLDQVHEPLRILFDDRIDGAVPASLFCLDGRAFVSNEFSGRSKVITLRDTATGRLIDTYLDCTSPMAVRGDGKVLICCTTDRRIRAIDLTSGRTLWTSEPQANAIDDLKYSPDGTQLLVIAHDRKGSQLWDAARGSCLRELKDGSWLFDRDGSILVLDKKSDDLHSLTRLDPVQADRAEIVRLPRGLIQSLGVSPDGRKLWASILISNMDRLQHWQGRFWDLATGEPNGQVFDQASYISFAPAGDRFISEAGQSDAEIALLRDASTGQALGSAFHTEGGLNITISPDGRRVLTRSDIGTTHLWKLARDPVRATIAGLRNEGPAWPGANDRHAKHEEFQAILAADGRSVVRWGFGPNARGLAQVIDPLDGRPAGIPARHGYQMIRAAALDLDGGRLATGSDPGTSVGEVRLFDVATGRPLVPPMRHINFVSALAFQPHGPLLAAGDYSGQVIFYDKTTGQRVGQPLLQLSIVWAMKFSPDGKTLAVGSHYEREGLPGVKLWDVASRRQVGELMRHSTTVRALEFRPDGRVLAAADGATVRLWDATRATAIGGPLERERAVAFRPDGRVFASAGIDGVIRIRDAATGDLLAEISLGKSPANCVAYRGDGRLIVAGYEDNTVRLIDPATTRPIGPPRSLHLPIAAVAFRDEGRHFVAVDEQGDSLTWAVPEELPAGGLDELTARVEARTGYRMEAGTSVVRLDEREWGRRIDQRDRSEGTPRADDGPGWHEPLALEAEANGNSFAALWHLDRMIAARPDDWSLLARRGRVRASAGSFDAAAADYASAERLAGREAILDWQAQCAADAYWRDHPAESLWHLDRLVAARPDDWTLREDRSAIHGLLGHHAEQAADLARALELGGDPRLVLAEAEKIAEAGRWAEASRLLSECGRRHPLESDLGLAWAVTCLSAGDRAGYREVHAAVLDRLRQPQGYSSFLDNCYTVHLCDVGDIPRWLLDRTESLRAAVGPKQAELYHWICTIQSGLLLRAGLFDEALARLDEVGASPGSKIREDFIWLILTHVAKGDLDSARRDIGLLDSLRVDEDGASFWEIQAQRWLEREAKDKLFDKMFPRDPFR